MIITRIVLCCADYDEAIVASLESFLDSINYVDRRTGITMTTEGIAVDLVYTDNGKTIAYVDTHGPEQAMKVTGNSLPSIDAVAHEVPAADVLYDLVRELFFE